MSQAPQVLSAGFLFYSHPPHSDDVYFLLGMDEYNGKWSDFGGRKNAEETEQDCAIREMVEESLFTVPLDGTTLPPADWAEYWRCAKALLATKQYTYRIGVDITPRRNKVVTTSRFDPSTLSVHYVCPFTRLDHIPCTSPGSLQRLRVCYVKYLPWQAELPERFAQTYEALHRLRTLPTLERQLHYYQGLSPELQTHPALRIERHEDGRIVRLVVRKEWLEKQQMAWWSLPRLKQALKNGGRYKRHVFRYGFLSTLGIVIERFVQSKAAIRSGQSLLCDVDGSVHLRDMEHAFLGGQPP